MVHRSEAKPDETVEIQEQTAVVDYSFLEEVDDLHHEMNQAEGSDAGFLQFVEQASRKFDSQVTSGLNEQDCSATEPSLPSNARLIYNRRNSLCELEGCCFTGTSSG
mmetsp:Transcript_4013/g.8223  ORF Transcript_4013/g.8223 Transcript_4013/m.8223 type:complete len:107 (-) Transcript_4013:28-348(-)